MRVPGGGASRKKLQTELVGSLMQRVDLLEGSIVRSLTKLSLPIMATALIQMAYNMTDMIWIGRVSANAVAAVGAAGMYLWLANGLAMIPGWGDR